MNKPGYIYLQPKYVSKFKCDGKICGANCCSRGWQISIDRRTYKKYSEIESPANELTSKIEYRDDNAGYFMKLEESGRCPFLTEENLCSIQLERGEEFLSDTCLNHPRQLYNFGEVIERTLSITCTLAADLILNSPKIEFEKLPVKLPAWAKGNLTVGGNFVPPELVNYIIPLQLTAVSILQERRLPLDGRLTVLGYYLYQAEETISRGDLNLLDTLNKIYTSEEFFQKQVPMLVTSINFQPLEFAELIFGVFGKIYRDNPDDTSEVNKVYIEKLCRAFGVNFETDEFNFQELAENYFDLGKIREVFVKDYAELFENYLVNDFFGGVYPFKLDATIQQNFAVFVVSFKILELIALSMTAFDNSDGKKLRAEIVEMISDVSIDLNHNAAYLNDIFAAVKDKADITVFMRALLQTI